MMPKLVRVPDRGGDPVYFDPARIIRISVERGRIINPDADPGTEAPLGPAWTRIALENDRNVDTALSIDAVMAILKIVCEDRLP